MIGEVARRFHDESSPDCTFCLFLSLIPDVYPHRKCKISEESTNGMNGRRYRVSGVARRSAFDIKSSERQESLARARGRPHARLMINDTLKSSW